jgi:cation transport regulator ChaC
MPDTFVFGYGSLLPRLVLGVPCVLRDHRRAWDVAMKNRVTVPGYKYYEDAATGERPDVFVTFLNIRPEPGGRVNGVAFEVDPRDLPALDRRERNYHRHDVTELIEGDVPGRVWAYIGTPAGRRRHARGVAAGTAIVTREYLDSVRADFESYSPEMLAEFEATTDPLDLPVRPLRRIEVPEDTYSGVT